MEPGTHADEIDQWRGEVFDRSQRSIFTAFRTLDGVSAAIERIVQRIDDSTKDYDDTDSRTDY